MIKTLIDVFDYLETHYGRKLSEAEKNIIRARMIVFGKSVQETFEDLGIDCDKVEIQ